MSVRLGRTSYLTLVTGSKRPIDPMDHFVSHPDLGSITTARQPIPALERKICDLADVQARVRALPRPLVLTDGVFDILHRDHATYLTQACASGASLMAGVNTDTLVQMLGEGDNRPLNTQDDHLAVLAALEAVSLVVLFVERIPVELIQRARPDTYVKGGDYDIDALEEIRVVCNWDGTTLAIPFKHNRSTTALLKHVRATF